MLPVRFIEVSSFFEESLLVVKLMTAYPDASVLVLEPFLAKLIKAQLGMQEPPALASTFLAIAKRLVTHRKRDDVIALMRHPWFHYPSPAKLDRITDKLEDIFQDIFDVLPECAFKDWLQCDNRSIDTCLRECCQHPIDTILTTHAEIQSTNSLSEATWIRINAKITPPQQIIIAGCSNDNPMPEIAASDIIMTRTLFHANKKLEPMMLWRKLAHPIERIHFDSLGQSIAQDDNQTLTIPKPHVLSVEALQCLLENPEGFYTRYICALKQRRHGLNPTHVMRKVQTGETSLESLAADFIEPRFWQHQFAVIRPFIVDLQVQKGSLSIGDYVIEGYAQIKNQTIIECTTSKSSSMRLSLLGWIARGGGFGVDMQDASLQQWVLRGYGSDPFEIIHVSNDAVDKVAALALPLLRL